MHTDCCGLKIFRVYTTKVEHRRNQFSFKNGMALYVIKLCVQPVSLERPSTSGPLIAFYDAAKS